MVITNEILQWAAILVLSVFVIGLTRQLGMFIIPRREWIEAAGPTRGKRVPKSLVNDQAAEQLRTLISNERSQGVAVVVIDDECAACRELLEKVEAEGGREAALHDLPLPVTVLLKQSQPAFHARARAAFPVVMLDPDGEATKSAGILGTPHVLILDSGLTLRESKLSANVGTVVGEYVESLSDAPFHKTMEVIS